MRLTISTIALAAVTAVVSCGGMEHMDHGTTAIQPSTVPIASITSDALFVVNGEGNSISVVNASTNEVAGTIAVQNAPFPHHVNLSPDKASLAVAIPGSDLSGGHGGSGHSAGHGSAPMGAILRLDALTGATQSARRLDGPNHNGIFSADGKEIWTSQMTMKGTVLVLDASTLTTKKTIPVGDMPAEVTFSRDGKYAFVANGMSNDVTVIDAAAKSLVKTIAVGADPVGAWSGIDGVMYVDNEAAKTLTAINATSLEVVRTYSLGFTPGMAATAPNGELWVTDSTNGKVVFYSTATGMKLGELATAAGAHAIAFSADGKAAYVSNQGAGSVSVINAAGRSIVKTIAVGTKPNGMVFRSKS
jgi:YVTN family beta-propeller protein